MLEHLKRFLFAFSSRVLTNRITLDRWAALYRQLMIIQTSINCPFVAAMETVRKTTLKKLPIVKLIINNSITFNKYIPLWNKTSRNRLWQCISFYTSLFEFKLSNARYYGTLKVCLALHILAAVALFDGTQIARSQSCKRHHIMSWCVEIVSFISSRRNFFSVRKKDKLGLNRSNNHCLPTQTLL